MTGLISDAFHNIGNRSALLPDGVVMRETIVVLVDKQGVPRYEAGRPVS